jgi:hypothetical protein
MMARSSELPPAKWPFMYVLDRDGRSTEWVILHAPIQSSSRRNLFAEFRNRGLRFLGMTSFMRFPLDTADDPLDYSLVCEGWCHCFRKPAEFLPAATPYDLISLSDFVDPDALSPRTVGVEGRDAPRFDFVYVGAHQPWKMQAKNWALAEPCLRILCNSIGMRGLVVGMPPGTVPDIRNLTCWPWLPHAYFLSVLARVRFLFVPNSHDPSPRVLAEALCLDVPVLVNRDILGGWKYVDRTTGRHFTDPNDVESAARMCVEASFQPRTWFRSHFGPAHAGHRLDMLLARIDAQHVPGGPVKLSYSACTAGGDRR